MNSDETCARDRLLHAAAEVFGECGYKGATVRDICRRAGVGIALVNYHFRDKEGLYLEVFRNLFTRALREYPPDMGLNESPSTEERLHAFIRSLLYRLTMMEGRHAIMLREWLDPSPSLVKLHAELTTPLLKVLSEILAGLVDPHIPQEQTAHCATSIIGQCMFYSPHSMRFRQQAFPMYQERQIDTIARSITAFSLGGIRAINEEFRARGESHEG